MTRGQAVMKLVEALVKAGYDAEMLDIENDLEMGMTVSLNAPMLHGVSVAVTEYWRFPDVHCYFVNFNGDDKNFSHCAGTPFVERALLDLGGVIEQANKYHLKKQEG